MGLEAVSGEVYDIDASEMMNFTNNPVLGETPKFVDLRLSTLNRADKLNPVFAPVTRAEGLTDHSNWLASRHRIAEVTADRVSKAKAYINYIKNSEFETRNVLERENIQLTRKYLTRQYLTRQDLTRQDENIPLTRLNEDIPLTRTTEFSENEKGHVPDNSNPEPSSS